MRLSVKVVNKKLISRFHATKPFDKISRGLLGKCPPARPRQRTAGETNEERKDEEEWRARIRDIHRPTPSCSVQPHTSTSEKQRKLSDAGRAVAGRQHKGQPQLTADSGVWRRRGKVPAT
ncbi:hypothetical protein E2C01_062989 [Portunus trituberculatus]|uniref:Uncharacterized protein n=1 Tax=Portunus trituberculatus TaxID=210409 RepID=A0A5B7HGB3_PORTR|nr:hypothetical protein [Portunus trituberculatus]